MKTLREYIKVSTIGAAMGVAEAIPGISGGTIAFIFKIYEELLNTIKAFSPQNLKLIFQGRFKDFFYSINGLFLLTLGVGMLLGLVTGVFGISYLIEHHKEVLWAFFFGLVLASSVYLAKDINWNISLISIFIFGAVISFGITLLSPVSGSSNLLFIFFCGVVAISALMLPGLSGSFILLLLGMYSTIIGSVKGLLSAPKIGSELWIVLTFGIGCLVGLFTFSRVLSYTFKKYYQPTMALMIGVLLGSLNKLWPWKIPTTIFDKESEKLMTWSEAQDLGISHYEVIKESNLLPQDYSNFNDADLFVTLLSFLMGIAIIGIIHFSDKKMRNKSYEH